MLTVEALCPRSIQLISMQVSYKVIAIIVFPWPVCVCSWKWINYSKHMQQTTSKYSPLSCFSSCILKCTGNSFLYSRILALSVLLLIESRLETQVDQFSCKSLENASYFFSLSVLFLQESFSVHLLSWPWEPCR